MTPYQRKGRPGMISGLSHEGKLTASGIENLTVLQSLFERHLSNSTDLSIEDENNLAPLLFDFIVAAMALHDHSREYRTADADLGMMMFLELLAEREKTKAVFLEELHEPDFLSARRI
jgi:hypothetical protein